MIDHSIDLYVELLREKVKEDVMNFGTLALGVFLIVFGVSLLGVAVLGWALGIGGIVAGGLVLAGR